MELLRQGFSINHQYIIKAGILELRPECRRRVRMLREFWCTYYSKEIENMNINYLAEKFDVRIKAGR